MVPFTLGKKIGTAGSKYRSNDIKVVSSEDFVYVEASAGTLILNGVDSVENSATVAADSYVAVRLTAPEIGKSVYSLLTIENRWAIFEVVSSVQGQLVFDENNPILPLDFYGYASHIGDNAWTADSEVALHKMSSSFVWQQSSDLINPKNRVLQQDYLFITNRWSNSVLRVDPLSLDLEQRIELERPVAVGRVAVSGEEPDIYHFFVALERGEVVRLSPDNGYSSPSDTIVVGSQPSDLLSVGNTLWIANSGSDSVTKINVANDLTTSVEEIALPPSCKPARIVQMGSHVYVTLFQRDAVAKINMTSSAVEIIEVGRRPFGITSNGSAVFALCQQDKSIWNVTDAQEVAVLDQTAAPVSIQSTANGFVVLDVEQKKSHYLDATYSSVRTFNASSPVETISYDGSVYLFVGAFNAHSQRVSADFYPENFEFDPSFGHDLEETVVSGTYTVSGLNTAAYLSVHSSVASLIVNGQPSSDTWVENGDTVQIQTVSSDRYGVRSAVLVSLGGESTQFITTTVEQKAIPDSVLFTPVDDATPLTEYVSNTVTISGIPTGLSIEASAIDGQLIHNEVIVTGTVLIETGDTVALKLTSGDLDQWRSAVLRIGPISATFAVASEKSVDNTCTASISPIFPYITDVGIRTKVESSIYTATNVNPEPVEISSSYNATMIVDEVDVGTSTVLSYGQQLQLRMEVTAAHSLDHEVVIHSCGKNYTWHAKTEPDRTPEFFSFNNVRDKDANEEVLSEVRTIVGIDSSISVMAEIYPEADVLVNGIRINTLLDYDPEAVLTFPVQLGDTIQIAGRAGSPFGTERKYTLTIGNMVTTYSVRSRPIDGAYERPNNIFLIEVAMGIATAKTGTSKSNVEQYTASPRSETVGREFDAVTPKTHNYGTRAESETSLNAEARRPIITLGDSYSFESRVLRSLDFEGMITIAQEKTTRTGDLGTSEIRRLKSETAEMPDSIIQLKNRKYFDQSESIRNILNRKYFDQPDTVRNFIKRKFFDQPDSIRYYFRSLKQDMPGVDRPHPTHVEYNETSWENPYVHLDHDVYQSYKPRVVTDHLLSEEAQFRMRTVLNFLTLGMSYEEVKRHHTELFESMYAQYNPFPHTEYDALAPIYNPVPFVEFDSLEAQNSSYHLGWVYIDQVFEQQNTAAQSYVFLNQVFQPKNTAAQAYVFLNQDFQILHSSSAVSQFNLQPWKISAGALNTFDGPFAAKLDNHYSTFSAEALKLLWSYVLLEEKEPELKPTDKFTMGPVGNIQRSFTSMDIIPPREVERNSNETFEDEDRTILTSEMMNYASSQEQAYQWAVDAGVDESRIQTYELHPGSWVWAEVLDQPNWCEDIDDSLIDSGWVKGG